MKKSIYLILLFFSFFTFCFASATKVTFFYQGQLNKGRRLYTQNTFEISTDISVIIPTRLSLSYTLFDGLYISSGFSKIAIGTDSIDPFFAGSFSIKNGNSLFSIFFDLSFGDYKRQIYGAVFSTKNTKRTSFYFPFFYSHLVSHEYGMGPFYGDFISIGIGYTISYSHFNLEFELNIPFELRNDIITFMPGITEDATHYLPHLTLGVSYIF